MKDKTLIAIAAIAILLVCGLIFDVGGGKTEQKVVVISTKSYDQAWTETTTKWVSGGGGGIGHMQVITTHHPAVYRLHAQSGEVVTVSGSEYGLFDKGNEVTIKRTIGNLTGIRYPWCLFQEKP